MKRIFVSLLTSLLSFLAILIYGKIIFEESSYSIILTLLYLSILYWYYKNDVKYDKKTKYYSLILSIIISLILSVGSIVSSYLYEPAINIFVIKNIIYCIISIVGFSILFYKFFCILFKKSINLSLIEKHNKMSAKQFLFIIGVIILSYSLYFVRYYPAIMTPDSYYVIHYSNNFILSDFHTFGHTWFFGIFFHLGKFLFNNINMAVAFSMVVQMTCMALIFSSAIRFLYNNGLKKSICIIILLFYTLNPLHAHYSITLWRDVMFGGSFVIILISLYAFVSSKEKIKVRYILLFITGILMMLFFRNNGIYVYLFMIPFMIIVLKKKRLLISILCFAIACFYFVIKGPIFDYFNIQKTTSVEAFSIPLQQMARVVASGREVSGNDREYLEKLFDYDKITTSYKNCISDPIKNITNNEILSNDKGSFFKTYISLFLKHPNVYVEAYFLQTLGYWYPDVIYWATAGESQSIFKEENVYSDPLTSEWYNNIIDITTSRKIPLCNIIWSVALSFILLLISSFVMVYRGNKKYLLCYVPLYGLWLSIVVATPVFCELRYVYGLFTCVPVVMALPFIINRKYVKESKND